jgi:hypothetical protein
LHQVRVDAQPAGGVDDDHVVELSLRLGDGGPRHPDGITDAVARLGCEHVHPGTLPHDLELGHRIGPLEVRGHEEG